MKRITITLLSVVALVMALLGVATPAAIATDYESGSEITKSSATSTSKTTASAHSVNGVSIDSDVTVLAYVQAKGATPKQMKAKKVRLPKAATLLTSYRNTAGQEAWHKKSYPKGKLLVWGKDGWWHDPICWNKVKFRTPKPVPKNRIVRGQVKVVQKFVFKATSTSAVDGNATATAKAWCRTAGSYSEAYGHGDAEFVARAYASGTGRTWSTAKANATSRSDEELRLQGHTESNVKIKVETTAKGKATSDAYAKAECSYTPPPEEEQPPPPPPAENRPPTGEIVQFPAHLYPGGEYRAKVVGSDPEDNGNVTLTYTVSGGASKIVDANHPEICDVEGTQRVCYFWIKAGNTAGTNASLTLTVKDSKGLTFSTSKSWPIVADEF